MLPHQEKLPDVFHMKPLNNWPANITTTTTAKVINVCRCTCHQDNKEAKTTLWNTFKQQMRRLKKSKVIVLIVGLVCFAIGLAFPFIFINRATNTASNDFLVHAPPLLNTQHKVLNNTLQDIFISVKTTRKYHYPRLIIQLETWASLAKSQVCSL